MKEDYVNEEEFLSYHIVKEANIIPLYEFQNIKQATKLDSSKLTYIMDHYSELCKKYLRFNK